MRHAAAVVLFMLSACSQGGHGSQSEQVGGSQNDAAPTPVTGSIACGAQTCGPDQFCFHDCCDTGCYAAPSGGCKDKSYELPSCNGVEHGCLCAESDPSKCPAPPSCDHATEPFCYTPPHSSFGCDFQGIGPCPAHAKECDPNNRVITCDCAM